MPIANPHPITPAILRQARDAASGLALPDSEASMLPIAASQRGAGVTIVYAAYNGCGSSTHNLDNIRNLKNQLPGINIVAVNVNGLPKHMPLSSSIPGKHIDYATRDEALNVLSNRFHLSITDQSVAVVIPGRPVTLLDSKKPTFANDVGRLATTVQRGVSRQ